MLLCVWAVRVKHRSLVMLTAVSMLLLEAPALARSLFVVPPTQVTIHNPESTENTLNRTTISVVVPADAGQGLGSIVLRQLPNIDQWDWGRSEPRVYYGEYALRAKGEIGRASAAVMDSGGGLRIQLTPAVQPGQTVNVVFRGTNPDSSIYQWSTELFAEGEDPVRYVGPTLRLSVYNLDPFR